MGSRNPQTSVTLGAEEEKIVDDFRQANGLSGRAAAVRQIIRSWGKVSAYREKQRLKYQERCTRFA